MRRALPFGLLSLVVLAAAGVAVWNLSKSRSFQLYGGMITDIPTRDSVVVLTFDDGPTPEGTRWALHTLDSLGVRATFFLTGQEIERRPELARALVEAGHSLGNHSYSHRTMMLVSRAFVAEEIERTDSLIRQAGWAGEIPFRPPFGKRLYSVPRYLSEANRKTIYWTAEPESYPEVAASAESITRHVVERARPGAIVLLHVMYASRAQSRSAVPMIVSELRARGYRFVTLAEALGSN